MEHNRTIKPITPEVLKAISPYITTQKANIYADLLAKCMREFGLCDNLNRCAMFLAQILHESGHLRYTEEIASGQRYEFRADLGNTEVGDGKKYKGRGLLQITGRANYEQMAKYMGLDLVNHPEILSTPSNAVLSACTWWSLRQSKLNKYADAGNIEGVTKIINGGLNGSVERSQLFEKAIKVLAV